MDLAFFLNSVLFGIGLAMDAFSVSLANGLNEPSMKKRKEFGIAGVFAFFQAAMPLLGWVCVHTFIGYFKAFEPFIPYISFVLLAFIGGKMIVECAKQNKIEDGSDGEAVRGGKALGFGALIVQGVATSIDALSVGFTIASYDFVSALVSALIISAVTLLICIAGVYIGKKAGGKLSGKAGYLGGAILIFIGFEILVTSLM